MTRKSGGGVRAVAKPMGIEVGGGTQDPGSSMCGVAEAGKPKLKRTRQYRRFARKLLSESFAAIMERIALESIGGSVVHTKFLFEVGGLTESLRNEGQAKGEPNLGELILNELERQRAEATAAKLSGGEIGTRDERGDDIAKRDVPERDIA